MALPSNMDEILKTYNFDRLVVIDENGLKNYPRSAFTTDTPEATTSSASSAFTDVPDNLNGDPVENFFKRLPLPSKDGLAPLGKEAFQRVKRACDLLEKEAKAKKSADPDVNYILEHIKRSCMEPIPAAYVFQQLCLLALSNAMADDDKSDKAEYLHFCRWVAQGRRDDCEPGSHNKSSSGASKAFLIPGTLSTKCAACGKDGAINKCAGCLIRTDGHLTSATAYCSKECQKKHWSTHKSACQQLKQIHRAMVLFQEILEHYFTIAFSSKYVAKEITEKDGMVVVKYTNPGKVSPGKKGLWSTFPHELAPSPDAGRAAMMHSRCPHILSPNGARALLEMLIRPTCMKLGRVAFEPKNIDKPVLVRHPDWDALNSVMNHEVLLATLACGAVVMLDPTGMQFGWKETIAPWATYQKHRISHSGKRHIIERMRPGTQFVSPDILTAAQTALHSSPDSILVESVVLSVMPQIKKHFKSVKDLLKLKGDEFTEARAAVLTSARGALSMLVEEIKNDAQMMVVNNIFDPRVLEDEEYVKVDMIWCTKKERDMALTGPEHVIKAKYRWNTRWHHVVRFRLAKNKAMDELVDSISVEDSLKTLEKCFEDEDLFK